MNKNLCIIAICLTNTPFALAEGDTDIADTGYKWKADSELGLVLTDGNTETQTINTKFQLEQEWTKWRNKAELIVLNTAEDNETSAEKYFISDKVDYKLKGANYLFGQLSYEDDRFSGFDFQATLSLGYGYRVLENNIHTLDLEFGPGYRVSKVQVTETTTVNGVVTEVEDTEDENETVARAALDYDYKISETAAFEQDFSVEAGSDNTISKSVTALKAQIQGSLAMKFSISVKYTEEVPDDKENTDTETAVTLVYSF